MNKITVFTPTYNRAHLLPRLYQSLLNQTNQDFCWLVIDDGSTDDTLKLLDIWEGEKKIDLKYIHQKNQGMHGGHNTAYANIETELNVCIDSDDFMPRTAIELILTKWDKIKDKKGIAGIVGLDANTNGDIIGTIIPNSLELCTLSGLYNKHGVRGDKKLVYRTEVIHKFPNYPLFQGERFVPLDYLYLLIDQEYKLATLNEILVIVDYQLDGSSLNILRQYRSNPIGFAFSRISRIRYALTFKEGFKNSIHLVSSAIFLNDFSILKKVKKPFLMLAAFPFGILLNVYIRLKTK